MSNIDTRKALELARDALHHGGIMQTHKAIDAIDAALSAPAAPVAQCACSPDVLLDSYAGGAAPEGLFGRVTLLINGQRVDYVPAPAAPVAQPWERIPVACTGIEDACDKILAVVDQPREPGWSYRNTITANRNAIRSLVACIREAHAALSAPAAPVATAGNELARFLALAEAAGFKSIHDVPGLIDALRAAAPAAPVAQPLPTCHVAVIGDRWDSEKLHHVPQLLIEFEPVPANTGNTAKGWVDRDALAKILNGICQGGA